MTLAKIIRYHFLCVLTPINLLFLLFTFIVNTLLVYSIYNDVIPEENIKATIFMFYLPINLNIDLFRWLLILLPLLIILGSFINTEIKERTTYLLIHMKSFNYWFHSFIIVCFSFIVLNFLVGFVITSGMVSFIPRNSVPDESVKFLHFFYQSNNSTLVVHQFFLLVLSVFLLVQVNILFAFLLDNSSIAFLITIICLIASIIVGYVSPDLLKWLPLTYGLLALRELANYSFIWSYAYILLSILVLYIIIFIIFRFKRESLFMNK